jgi:hypothetical protein
MVPDTFKERAMQKAFISSLLMVMPSFFGRIAFVGWVLLVQLPKKVSTKEGKW